MMPPAARCRLSTLSVDVGALAEQLFLGAAMIGVVFWHWRPLDPYLLHDARRKRLQLLLQLVKIMEFANIDFSRMKFPSLPLELLKGVA
jgi:hypothetical protein